MTQILRRRGRFAVALIVGTFLFMAAPVPTAMAIHWCDFHQACKTGTGHVDPYRHCPCL